MPGLAVLPFRSEYLTVRGLERRDEPEFAVLVLTGADATEVTVVDLESGATASFNPQIETGMLPPCCRCEDHAAAGPDRRCGRVRERHLPEPEPPAKPKRRALRRVK